jgi:hypothetical protein
MDSDSSARARLVITRVSLVSCVRFQYVLISALYYGQCCTLRNKLLAWRKWNGEVFASVGIASDPQARQTR